MIPEAKQIKNLENRINKLTTYSPEEQVIGTWINGKPLYRKVLSFITSDTTYSMKTQSIDVDNIDLCFIGSKSIILSSVDGSIYMVNAARAGSDTALFASAHNWFRINPNRQVVAYIVGQNCASSQCYLELVYTKTTD